MNLACDIQQDITDVQHDPEVVCIHQVVANFTMAQCVHSIPWLNPRCMGMVGHSKSSIDAAPFWGPEPAETFRMCTSVVIDG